ncbi:MAG: hypothetical protein HRT76_04770 [Halieaceae bacterium]|nr:hypothetical protein [Halieaceae bacterium]
MAGLSIGITPHPYVAVVVETAITPSIIFTVLMVLMVVTAVFEVMMYLNTFKPVIIKLARPGCCLPIPVDGPQSIRMVVAILGERSHGDGLKLTGLGHNRPLTGLPFIVMPMCDCRFWAHKDHRCDASCSENRSIHIDYSPVHEFRL